MRSPLIVIVEPPGQGGFALLEGAVDPSVGPTRKHRADEALRFAVGAGAVGPRAQMAEAQSATGPRLWGAFIEFRALTRAFVRGWAG